MKKVLAILLIVVVMIGTAAAESWTVFVVGFDFISTEVILEDEDGFLWLCPFGEHSWTLGDEYQLVLTEETVEICE